MRQTHRVLRPGWVAGSIRGRQLLGRRMGRDRSRALADSPSLAAALAALQGTAYGRGLPPGASLAEAQRSLAATALWHARILSGWLPPRAVASVRALVAWFELVNVEERIDYLTGGELRRPFALGGLATAWTHVAEAQTLAEVREALVGTPWGDPGSEEPGTIRLALRIAWARRVLDVKEAEEWAAGAMALLVCRELLLAGRRAEDLEALRPPGIGRSWPGARTLPALRDSLPDSAAWPLAELDEPSELWRGEAAWWRRVEADAERLVRSPELGPSTVIGSLALLGVDAWRVAAALEVAARGPASGAREVFAQIG